MVCGGSMAPSVFRLTSTNKIAALGVPANVVSQTAIFTEDRVSPSHQCAELKFRNVNTSRAQC